MFEDCEVGEFSATCDSCPYEVAVNVRSIRIEESEWIRDCHALDAMDSEGVVKLEECAEMHDIKGECGVI